MPIVVDSGFTLEQTDATLLIFIAVICYSSASTIELTFATVTGANDKVVIRPLVFGAKGA